MKRPGGTRGVMGEAASEGAIKRPWLTATISVAVSHTDPDFDLTFTNDKPASSPTCHSQDASFSQWVQ
jgi:hypothetical protein